MKRRARKLLAALATTVLLTTINHHLSTALAQGTAFTYQGQLQSGGALANGTFSLQFLLYTNNSGGTAVVGPVTNNGVGVSNGLFTVIIDFGAGPWNGESNWLEIAVETNGGASFTTLAPRQEVTPTPYAIYAESVTASGISGTLVDAQLTHSAVTVNPGPGLSGGGRVSLGNTIILTNTGVLSVTGNADITATTVSGAVTLGDTATNTDTPNTIVKRDGSGNFSANNITLDGTLTMPGVGSDIIYSGSTLLFDDDANNDLFVGYQAGNTTTTGSLNTGIGNGALANITTGARNTADGFGTLFADTAGSFNTATGADALENNTNANGNTADGYAALNANLNGVASTAIGSGAMLNNTSGSYNSVLGNNALLNNTTASNNTAVGYEALFSNTGDASYGGSENTATGSQALFSNTLGFDNTANGYQALYSNQGSELTGNGAYNTANGAFALYNNTSGYDNSANGAFALNDNTSGHDNTANGFQALYFNTNGADNVAVGSGTLLDNPNGQNNTGIGYQACENNIGGGNTAVGSHAFFCTNQDEEPSSAMNNNTAIGANALSTMAGGDNNTAVGWSALDIMDGGNLNIALGYRAGENVTTGSSNIEIGNNGTASDNAIIRIGTKGTQTTTYIAGISGVTISPTGAAVFVNSDGQLGTINSSRRYKQDIRDMGDQSDVLLSLRPVAFRYKHELDPTGAAQFGLIAEEVEKVAPELVLRDEQGKIYSVRYEQINAMLLNEFLKEHQTVEQQNTKLQELNRKMGAQDSENKELKQRLEALEKIVLGQKSN